MRPHLCVLLAAVFGLSTAWAVDARAQTTDQLLREVSAYLSRDSCESARTVLAEIPEADRDGRAHLLVARTGRCLGDVGMTLHGLEAFEGAGGDDPIAAELRTWAASALGGSRSAFELALQNSDCGNAGLALRKLEDSTGRPLPIERGLLALCRRDGQAVGRSLLELSDAQLLDPRVKALLTLLKEIQPGLRRDFERHLDWNNCAAADSSLRLLELVAGQPLSADRALVARCHGLPGPAE